MPIPQSDIEPCDALMLFGVTGDLAYKSLFPALHDLVRDGRLDVRVIGIGRTETTTEELRDRAEASMREHVENLDEAALKKVRDLLSYVEGDYAHEDTWKQIASHLEGCERPLAYLAVPPFIFADVIAGLTSIGANKKGGVVLEKPFGRDYGSALELDAKVQASFPEKRIYRIDHFLGKETVLAMMMFRLANPIMDALLRRDHVDHIQITMSEDYDVAERGSFYDSVGAMRDVVQNHLLQVMAAMLAEPPTTDAAEDMRDEKSNILKAMRPVDPDEAVMGQYVGFRDVEGVAKDSVTDTFVSLIAWVDTWRWAGVPIYIRAGKAMDETRTEVAVVFKRPALSLYRDDPSEPSPNTLRFLVKPGERVDLGVQLKESGHQLQTHHVDLSYEWTQDPKAVTAPYARLIGDALVGDRTLFARSDSVMASWKAVQPLLDSPPEFGFYEPGEPGPKQALRIAPPGGWLPSQVEK